MWSRALFWLATFFAAGVATGYYWPWPTCDRFILAAVLVLLVSAWFALLSRSSSPRSPILALVLFFALGLFAGRASAPCLPTPPSLETYFERPQTLFIAEVASPADFYPNKIRIPLRLEWAITGGKRVPVNTEALLSLDSTKGLPSDCLPGERFLVPLTLKRFHNFNNPGGYDYVRNQADQGYYARAHLRDNRLLLKVARGETSWPLSSLHWARGRLDQFRQEALGWLRINLNPETAAFFAALLLGYQHLISATWSEHLARTGVTHLLSISGLHLGLVSLVVFWTSRRVVRIASPKLLRRMSDQHIAIWPALLSAFVYACIAGLVAAPVFRSLLMLTICFFAASHYRPADSLTALAAAALVILTMDPNSLLQISFQLTFACMFAIFSLYPRLQPFHLSRSSHGPFSRERYPGRILAPFEEAFWVSIAVNLAVMPLTVYYFYGISLAAFAANIVLVPFVGFLVLPPGLASLALFAVNETVALPVLKAGAWCLELSQSMIAWFSHLSWAYFWVGTVPLYLLIGCYGALALLFCPWEWQKKAIGLATLSLLLAGTAAMGSFTGSPKGEHLFRVTFIDVNQGASTLLQFPTGETMLVDGGGFFDESFDIGRAVLAPFLWHSGIRKLDHVVLSHDHPDHGNGLRFILSHFDVGHFWHSGVNGGNNVTSELASIATKRHIHTQTLPEIYGDHPIGESRVRVLHPDPSYVKERWDGKDLNNVSLVLQVDFGEAHLVLPADIDQSVENILFRDFSLSGPTILAAPHHGSVRSSGPTLLDRLHPTAIVFSCGFDNLFGFPSSRVLEEAERRHIPRYRTDLQGAIVATSDGLDWKLSPSIH